MSFLFMRSLASLTVLVASVPYRFVSVSLLHLRNDPLFLAKERYHPRGFVCAFASSRHRPFQVILSSGEFVYHFTSQHSL